MPDGAREVLQVEVALRVERGGVFGRDGDAYPLEMLVDVFRDFLRKAVGNQPEVDVQGGKVFDELGEMRPQVGLAATGKDEAAQADIGAR